MVSGRVGPILRNDWALTVATETSDFKANWRNNVDGEDENAGMLMGRGDGNVDGKGKSGSGSTADVAWRDATHIISNMKESHGYSAEGTVEGF